MGHSLATVYPNAKANAVFVRQQDPKKFRDLYRMRGGSQKYFHRATLMVPGVSELKRVRVFPVSVLVSVGFSIWFAWLRGAARVVFQETA
jgi:hypothetical protein